MRINAAAHKYGLTYSEFMFKLKTNKISLNRKVLADLAMNNPNAFEAIVKSLK
jgi:large subunit ribosomal protein L20